MISGIFCMNSLFHIIIPVIDPRKFRIFRFQSHSIIMSMKGLIRAYSFGKKNIEGIEPMTSSQLSRRADRKAVTTLTLNSYMTFSKWNSFPLQMVFIS